MNTFSFYKVRKAKSFLERNSEEPGETIPSSFHYQLDSLEDCPGQSDPWVCLQESAVIVN